MKAMIKTAIKILSSIKPFVKPTPATIGNIVPTRPIAKDFTMFAYLPVIHLIPRVALNDA